MATEYPIAGFDSCAPCVTLQATDDMRRLTAPTAPGLGYLMDVDLIELKRIVLQ